MDRGSGDIFYHLSVVLHIQNTGSILQTDTYPMMHIILAILQFTSVDLMMLAFMISIVFFILYVFFFYILGKTVLGSTRGGILFSVFALPLVFSFAHYAYYPFLFALFLIPLVLFILSKLNTITQNRSGYYVCIVGLSLFITYCHPLIAIIIFIMFSIFALFKIFYHGLTGIYKSNNVAMNIAFISFSTFSLWYIQHMSLMQTSERVFSSIFGDSNADTILNYQMNVLSASDASPWLVAERFIKYYGPVSLYIFISLIFVMYSVFNYYRNGKIHTQDTIYSIHFIAAIFIGALLVMENLVIFEPIRAVSYCLIFSTILCGLFFYRLYESRIENNKNRDISFGITLIIGTVCILSILSLFPSPWIGAVNPAFTLAEKQGSDWTIKNNINTPVLTEEVTNIKYINYYNENIQNHYLQESIIYSREIPSHFGYNETWPLAKSLANLNEGTLFMVTTDLMEMAPYAVPSDRRDRMKWFTDSDFNLLKQDPTVDFIYSNVGYNVWRIRP